MSVVWKETREYMEREDRIHEMVRVKQFRGKYIVCGKERKRRPEREVPVVVSVDGL